VTALPCATCQGTGWVPDPKLPHTRNEPCRDCNGTGEDTHDVEQSPVLEVDEEYELDELTGQWRRVWGS
jgi:DnaJ-class molecular chaperone